MSSPNPPYQLKAPRALNGRFGWTSWLLPLTLALLLASLAGSPSVAESQRISSRQVTLFGILANPTLPQEQPTVDPKLQPIATQLRQLFPGHDFKLVGVETQRLPTGRSLSCQFNDGYSAKAQLTDPLDSNGKARLRFQLSQRGGIDFATIVSTPINQLFFLDKRLSDGSKLIMGIGVRE